MSSIPSGARLGFIASLAGCAMLSSGCETMRDIAGLIGADQQTTAALEAAGTAGEAGLIAVSQVGPLEERAYGDAVLARIVSDYGGLVEDEQVVRYVNLVGYTLVDLSQRPVIGFDGKGEEMRWHFFVVNSSDPQALACPGGYVLITAGLLARIENEAELAGVLSHEIGHVVKRHAVDIIQNQKATSRLADAAEVMWSDLDAFSDSLDKMINNYLETGYAAGDEYEADEEGVKLAAAAGYDPRGLRNILGRIHDEFGESQSNALTRTHPPYANRLERIEDTMDDLPMGGRRLGDRYQRELGAWLASLDSN